MYYKRFSLSLKLVRATPHPLKLPKSCYFKKSCLSNIFLPLPNAQLKGKSVWEKEHRKKVGGNMSFPFFKKTLAAIFYHIFSLSKSVPPGSEAFLPPAAPPPPPGQLMASQTETGFFSIGEYQRNCFFFPDKKQTKTGWVEKKPHRFSGYGKVKSALAGAKLVLFKHVSFRGFG